MQAIPSGLLQKRTEIPTKPVSCARGPVQVSSAQGISKIVSGNLRYDGRRVYRDRRAQLHRVCDRFLLCWLDVQDEQGELAAFGDPGVRAGDGRGSYTFNCLGKIVGFLRIGRKGRRCSLKRA